MAFMSEIAFLPGAYWAYKGEESWVTSSGKTSFERHAVLPDGRRISVRQAQAMQRAARAEAGQPKAPAIARKGRTRIIKDKSIPGTNTYAGQVGSLYNPESHGKRETWVFRSFNELRVYMINHNPPSWAHFGIIQIRFTERLIVTNKVGSGERTKNGYATISRFVGVRDLEEFVLSNYEPRVGRNPWLESLENLQNYDMSGSSARVYMVWQEK